MLLNFHIVFLEYSKRTPYHRTGAPLTPLGHHAFIRARQSAGLSLERDFVLVTERLVHTANLIPAASSHTPVTEREKHNDNVEDEDGRSERVAASLALQERALTHRILRLCTPSPQAGSLSTVLMAHTDQGSVTHSYWPHSPRQGTASYTYKHTQIKPKWNNYSKLNWVEYL